MGRVSFLYKDGPRGVIWPGVNSLQKTGQPVNPYLFIFFLIDKSWEEFYEKAWALEIKDFPN